MIVQELFAKVGLDVEEEDLHKVEAFFTSGKVKLAAFAGAVAGIGMAFYALAQETAKTGEEVERASQRVGVSTDAYQELKFAAEESGVSVAGLETALFKMSRAAYEAKQGSAEAAKAFHGLLSLKDLKELSPDEQLQKLADGFNRIKDPGERAQKVMAIFGRGGAELIPLLSKGAAGMEELREKAHELGVVLDEDTIKNAKEFNERSREMKARLEGVGYAIGSKVLGVLNGFSRALNNAGKAMKAFFGSEAGQQIKKFVTIVLFGGGLIIAAMKAWQIAEAIYFGFTVAGWGAVAMSAIRSAAATIVAWATAAAPFIAVAAGVAVLILWLEDLYQFLTGGDSVIGDFVAALKDSLGGGVMNLFKDIGAWLMHFLPDTVKEAAERAGEWLVKALTGAWAKVSEFFRHPINAVFGSGATPAPGSTGMGGGAASPGASAGAAAGTAGGSKSVAVHAPITVTVTTQPGMTPDQIVGAIDRKITDHHEKVTREAMQASP